MTLFGVSESNNLYDGRISFAVAQSMSNNADLCIFYKVFLFFWRTTVQDYNFYERMYILFLTCFLLIISLTVRMLDLSTSSNCEYGDHRLNFLSFCFG